MEQMTPECFGIWMLALAVFLGGFVLASMISARREARDASHRLTGPDAALDDDEDIPTADGEPADVGDTIITIYAPSHLPALGYVVVPSSQRPSRQRRQRLDCSESEARND